MGLGIGPDPVARSLETAQPSASAPETAQTLDRNALTPAMAALPERRVAGLDQMMQTVSGHLNAIRGGAAPPPNFAGALAAHDQVGESRVADPRHACRRPLHTRGAERGSAERSDAERAVPERARAERSGAGITATHPGCRKRAHSRRCPGCTQPRSGRHRARRGTISAEDANRIEAKVRALGPGDTRRLFVGVPASDGHASVAGLSVPEVTKWMTAVSLHSPQQRTLLFDMLASRNLSADSFTTLARGIQAGTESRFSQADVTDGRLLGESIGRYSIPEVRAAFAITASHYVGAGNSAVGLAVGSALAALPRMTVSDASHGQNQIGPTDQPPVTPERIATLDATLDALREAHTLRNVIEGSVYTYALPKMDRQAVSHVAVEADTLAVLLRTASLSTSGYTKAIIADAAASQLGQFAALSTQGRSSLSAEESTSQIRHGITAMLEHDPVGILTAHTQYISSEGDGYLPNYFGSVIQAGESQALHNIVQRLETGDGAAPSSGDWAAMVNPNPAQINYVRYLNAQTLGVTVRGIGHAIASDSDSVRASGKLAHTIFDIGAGAGPAIAPEAGPVIPYIKRGLDAITDAIVDFGVNKNKELLLNIQRDVLPRYAADPSLPDGTPGESLRGDAHTAYMEAVEDAMDASIADAATFDEEARLERQRTRQ